MENLGDRIRLTLKGGGLTPRHLGGATKIHYVTIYRQMSNKDGVMAPLHKQTLVDALGKIEKLIKQGKLPMQGKLSRKEKTDTLKSLLAQTD